MNQAEIETAIKQSKTMQDLDSLRIELFGKHGYFTRKLKEIPLISSIEQRKKEGATLNAFKRTLTEKISMRENEVLSMLSLKKKDMTLPGEGVRVGELHLVTKAIEDIRAIFSRIGFYQYTYYEVEWEYFAFDALNMGADHAARDDIETFFVDAPPSSNYGKMVLTPHTSSGQVRELLRRKKPPVRMISIARCNRINSDPSHTPMFHQFEGLCIDRNVTIEDLKGTIAYFARSFYGDNVKTRIRPHHFQFTEPSFEVDISCTLCNGTGKGKLGEKCKMCKSGWLELGGAGMVHPHILESGNVDPNEYSGWAFGLGVERVALMRGNLQLDDVRRLYGNDVSLYDMT